MDKSALENEIICQLVMWLYHYFQVKKCKIRNLISFEL